MGVYKMKKIITLCSLLAFSGAYAQTSSETDLKQEKKSFTDKLSGWHLGIIGTDKVTTRESDGANNTSSMFNMFNFFYTHNDNLRFNMILRNNISDNGGASRSDLNNRFNETMLNPRIGAQYFIYKSTALSIRPTIQLELPMTVGSPEERIGNVRPGMQFISKIDDYNSLFWGATLIKAVNTRSVDPVDETSRHLLTNWIQYTNTYLSEKYQFSVQISTAAGHMPGYGDLALKSLQGSENALVGVAFNVGKVNVYPYVQHDPSEVKSVDRLGGGVQLFTVF